MIIGCRKGDVHNRAQCVASHWHMGWLLSPRGISPSNLDHWWWYESANKFLVYESKPSGFTFKNGPRDGQLRMLIALANLPQHFTVAILWGAQPDPNADPVIDAAAIVSRNGLIGPVPANRETVARFHGAWFDHVDRLTPAPSIELLRLERAA